MVHGSMAKAQSADAAMLAARAALQCHGAIGYSFEHDRAIHVSMAKAYASDAALVAARAALQCHGAIGYSFEHDLHLWMKRVWALVAAFGDRAWHRERVARAILDRTT
jgi:alkylation response protein AidB-like acyl-CoA dehydrogenase